MYIDFFRLVVNLTLSNRSLTIKSRIISCVISTDNNGRINGIRKTVVKNKENSKPKGISLVSFCIKMIVAENKNNDDSRIEPRGTNAFRRSLLKVIKM